MNKSNSTGRFGASKLLFLLSCTTLIASGGACKKSGSSPDAGPSPPSANSFEGMVAMKMNTAGAQGIAITYYIRGQRARMETTLPGQPRADNVVLWDASAGKMTSLLVSQKTYSMIDLDAMSRMAKGRSSPESQTFPKLTDTGKEETIAGYPCHDWLIGDKQIIEVCVAKGLGAFGMSGSGGNGLFGHLLSPQMSAEAAAHPEWAKLTEGGAFPLKTTMSENGKTTFTMEATSVERKKIDDSLLVVPSDYKEFKAPALPGGAPPKQ
jgi:hypothetical protein